MNADWHIPAESPLAGLAYAVAQEKLHAVLQQAKVAGPKKLQARSLREAQAFCCLMRKTRVALLQDGADLDVLVVSSSQADLLGASGVSLISFELSKPNFSDKGLGAGPSSLIPPHGFVALAMRTIMEVESELQAGRPGDAEKVDLAVDGILDVLEGIPLNQSSVPPEAFGDDAYFQSLSPEKKAQFTRVELVRLVGQLRAIGADPAKVENTRFFIAGQRPVKIENTPKGDREFAIDWKTGEFIKTDLYIRKIFRDHSPDIDEVDQATFEKRVAKIRAKINQIIGFEIVLGGPGLSGTLENFTFRETGITAFFGEDPNSRLELGFDSPILGALLKELQACSFPSLGQGGANGAAPDTLFRTIVRDASGKDSRLKGKVFSRKVLADAQGPSAEALQSIMHWVEAVKTQA